MPVVLNFNDKYTFPRAEGKQYWPARRCGLASTYISGIGLRVLHLHHAAEAHEGHSEDAGGDEGDGNALHRGGQLGA